MNSSRSPNASPAIVSPVLAIVGAGLSLGSLAVDDSALKVLMRVVAVMVIALSGVFLGLVLRSPKNSTLGR